MPAPITARRCNASVVAGAAAALLLALSLGLAGDRPTPAHAALRLDLKPLMLWAWDHDDDLRFIDTRDTGIAHLAATLTLRGDDVALMPRHNPLTLPRDAVRVAVAHVETDRVSPPRLSHEQLGRFVAALIEVAEEVPQRALQVDFEATASQRAFLVDAIAELRRQRPMAAISVTALASWCATENWTGALAADEVVPMLFRMGYDGRRVRARLANGSDFGGPECRRSIGVASDELPQTLPPGRRIYAFNPRRWSADTYQTVRARIDRWSHDGLPD